MAVATVHVRSWRESFAGLVPQSFLDKMSVEKRTAAFAAGFLDDSYKMYVAENTEGVIVGFADCGESRESIEGYEAELFAIYLVPEYQRRGVGGELFKRVINALVRRGKRSMYLEALEVSPYRSFYEQMGGQVIERRETEIEGEMFNLLVYGWEDLVEIIKLEGRTTNARLFKPEG